MNICFSRAQLVPLYPAIVLLILSIIVFLNGKEKLGLILLFAGGIMLGIFMALLDPFLVLWDEQYHALVAKNMSVHPFTPMLVANPVLDYDYRNWTLNHIWLHKQPLFLWQMALSIKIFGANAFAVRLPSIMMHALVSLMIFRIGKIIYNANAGFYAALFFLVAYYPLELLCGRMELDHNDVAFMFYVAASFWTFTEYLNDPKIKWIILIGIFAGTAVLVKWLTGLLVYACWMIVILLSRERRKILSSYKNWLGSIAIAVFIFIPWQIYAYYNFPNEYNYERSLNTKHFFEPIEGHSGAWWYHFEGIREIYGRGILIPVLIVLSIIVLLLKIKKPFRIFLLSAIIIVYCFFSLAATKMVSYGIIISPIIFLGFGVQVERTFFFMEERMHGKEILIKIVTAVALIVVSILLTNVGRIERNHTMKFPKDNHQREKWMTEFDMIKKIPSEIPSKNYVVFNCPQYMNVPVMFFTDLTAYDFLPTEKQAEEVKEKGYKIAIFNDGKLPARLKGELILK